MSSSSLVKIVKFYAGTSAMYFEAMKAMKCLVFVFEFIRRGEAESDYLCSFPLPFPKSTTVRSALHFSSLNLEGDMSPSEEIECASEGIIRSLQFQQICSRTRCQSRFAMRANFLHF